MPVTPANSVGIVSDTAQGIPTAISGIAGTGPKTRVDQVKDRISQTNDIGELLRIYRGFFNKALGNDADATNALAGDKLSQMTGLDRNALSSMHDAEITQAYQGQQEKKQIEDLATKQQGQINEFADQQQASAKTYRDQLATSLQKNNQQAFELQNPYILEDLNKRGLFTSPTAVAGAQTDAMKELEVDRQNRLLQFDTGAFNDVNDLRQGGLSNLIGGQQSALDTALNARRGGLQMAMDQINSQSEQNLAQSLARRKSRDSLYGSLIQAGGNIIGSGVKAAAA